ncbi:hypothetical protein FGO68_gene1811 [Halteria grandinella]|uniref:Uncharacterized protein n=1 Tax=Halteria grandinella TaxID=5974 RepID=A0A8J8NYE9_HALGN|nr:hypothetical protein FGO68_gene1811 [Halteria grandinella]
MTTAKAPSDTVQITTHLITDLLAREHPDVQYLKQDSIALALSKCLSQTFAAKPQKPIEYFAKTLLSQSHTTHAHHQQKQRERHVRELKERNSYFIKQKLIEQEEHDKEERTKQDKIDEFYKSLDKSSDLADNLGQLAGFLQEFTGATGVYVGKLEHPRLPIDEKDNDKAHVDRESAKVLKFVHASPADHKYMEGKILKPGQGVTHEVFNAPDMTPRNPAGEEGEGEDGEKKGAVVPHTPRDTLVDEHYHVYVKEVVREGKMHFYRVPRLGAYMAIPLEYYSCLSQKALDLSITDYIAYQKACEELEKAKKDWDEENEKFKEEKEKAGEIYVPEERTWPAISEKPFHSKLKKFAVCMDTLGQDREFTVEQRRFALQTVQNFAQIWERREQENLTKDRNLRLQMLEIDKEFNENVLAKLTEEEDDFVREHIANINNPESNKASQQVLPTEHSDNDKADSRAQTPAQRHPYNRMDEEQKDLYQRVVRLRYQATQIKSSEPAPVMPVFNKQEFTAKWLTDNPPIEIPEPIVDDVDNDWILSASETEYHINTYFGKE